jgi:hypothetical protein
VTEESSNETTFGPGHMDLDNDDEIRLTPPDWAAAEEVLAICPHVPVEQRNHHLGLWAGLHAQWGASKFRLRFRLRTPRNWREELDLQFFTQKITRQEFEDRTRARMSRPVDVELLNELLSELEARLVDCGRYVDAVHSLTRYGGAQFFERADRYSRRMNRKFSLYRQEIVTATDFLREARLKTNQQLAKVGNFTAPTIAELTSLVRKQAGAMWKKCRGRAKEVAQEQMPLKEDLEELRRHSGIDSLPLIQDLQALLRLEFKMAQMFLSERERPVTPRPDGNVELHIQGETVQVNLSQAQQPRTSKSKTPREPLFSVAKWDDLALGIDGKRYIWAVTPPPGVGADFPKSRAKKVTLRGMRWNSLLNRLAESKTGNCAEIGIVAAALGLQGLGSNVPRDSRARQRALEHGHREDLSTVRSPWRGKLNEILADLGRKLRAHIQGPVGKGDSALWAEDDFVYSGFVVRHLLPDGAGHLKFGRVPE